MHCLTATCWAQAGPLSNAIPGSRWIAAEALDEHLTEIPRDRELIVYCS